MDAWRLNQLDKATADPLHPYSKFGTGNKFTLDTRPREQNIDVREELLKFHSSFYSANMMAMAVIGRGLYCWANKATDKTRHVLAATLMLPICGKTQQHCCVPYGHKEWRFSETFFCVQDTKCVHVKIVAHMAKWVNIWETSDQHWHQQCCFHNVQYPHFALPYSCDVTPKVGGVRFSSSLLSESLDELAEIAVKLLSSVQDKDVPIPHFPDHPYGEEQLQVRHWEHWWGYNPSINPSIHPSIYPSFNTITDHVTYNSDSGMLAVDQVQ